MLKDEKRTMDRRYMVGAFLTRVICDGHVWDVHRCGLRSWLLFIPIVGADASGQGGFAQPEHIPIARRLLRPEIARVLPA